MQGPDFLTDGIITRMLEFERRRFFLVHLCNAERQKGLDRDTDGPDKVGRSHPGKAHLLRQHRGELHDSAG
jgi:hypothetical protein